MVSGPVRVFAFLAEHSDMRATVTKNLGERAEEVRQWQEISSVLDAIKSASIDDITGRGAIHLFVKSFLYRMTEVNPASVIEEMKIMLPNQQSINLSRYYTLECPGEWGGISGGGLKVAHPTARLLDVDGVEIVKYSEPEAAKIHLASFRRLRNIMEHAEQKLSLLIAEVLQESGAVAWQPVETGDGRKGFSASNQGVTFRLDRRQRSFFGFSSEVYELRANLLNGLFEVSSVGQGERVRILFELVQAQQGG